MGGVLPIGGTVSGSGDAGSDAPQYACFTRFDARAGEDIDMRLDGLPANGVRESSINGPWASGGCPLTDVLHGAVADDQHP